MKFPIGLLSCSRSRHVVAPAVVLKLLERIDGKLATQQNNEPLSILSFVQTPETGMLFENIASKRYSNEFFTFGPAGVIFNPQPASIIAPHSTYSDPMDYDLAMKALLSRCYVIVILCDSESEFATIKTSLDYYRNTCVLIALVSIEDGRSRFFEIDPELYEIDTSSWLLRVSEQFSKFNDSLTQLPKNKITVLGWIFPLIYSTVIRAWAETVKKRSKSLITECRAGMGFSAIANEKLDPADRDRLNTVVELVCPLFIHHDRQGRHYSNVFRTTCFLVPTLITAATLAAVVALTAKQRSHIWHLTEGSLLIAALILFLRSKLANYHAKWVQHRLMTELLRPILFNTMFYTIPQLTPPTEESDLWVDQSRLFLCHLRHLPLLTLTTGDDGLLSSRVSTIRDFAAYQARWHKDFAYQHRTAAKWLTKRAAHGFIVTLCFCALQLLLGRFWLPQPEIAVYLTILTLLCACGAFVLSLLSHQLGFEAIAERSSNAASRFRRLEEEINAHSHAADAHRVYVWREECANAILAEQHSWYRHIPLIRMHL